MRAVLAFLRLARLPFLAGGFAGCALGAAVARFDGATLSFGAYATAQALVTAFHLMVHFSNDYFDRAGDALAERTAWSGGSGVLTKGELAPAVALRAALICGAIGVGLTAWQAIAGNIALATIGVAIGALSWAYSAPPWRLLARGLGEADAALVVAVLVPLAGAATFAHHISPTALLATVPGAFAMIAMMLAVEVPDRAADAASGKRNLVVRLGPMRTMPVLRWAAAAGVIALAAVLRLGFAAPALALLAVLPAAVVAALLWVRAATSARGTIPFLGVALYGCTCMGAAVAIALAR